MSSKLPTYRTTRDYPASKAAQALADVLRHCHPDWIFKSCINCDHFDKHGKELCTKAQPPVRPPAEIIVRGCEAWEEEIPF